MTTPTAFSLSDSQIEEFFTRGFFCVENVFTRKEIAEMGTALDRITEMASPIHATTMHKGAQFVVDGSRIDRVVWCGAVEPVLLDYAKDPRLLNPVSQLLGSQSMQQLICQFHPKLPGDQVAFDWHQDSQHRAYGTEHWEDINGKGSYVQTLTAIDEITLDNGPVCFVPSPYTMGHLSLDKNDVNSLVDLSKAVPLLMKPGSTAFFGPYVVHGSKPNNSNKKRRVFINGYAYPGANKRDYPGEGSGRILRII